MISAGTLPSLARSVPIIPPPKDSDTILIIMTGFLKVDSTNSGIRGL
jgi:hypothetical protein